MYVPDAVLHNLLNTYHPDAMIVYGSFADGSANEHSDFDALLIADGPARHDTSIIDGVMLDVFLYPPETFQTAYAPEDFVQIHDGEILFDRSGLAAGLKAHIQDFLAQQPRKSDAELRSELDWCHKMLLRTARGDPEGYFRWHWLLYDSLEIYCDLKQLPYYGPKKALRAMAAADAEAYHLYCAALQALDSSALSAWISCLSHLLPTAASSDDLPA